MTRSYTLEGIIIKRANWGEAARLVTIFTRTHGKVTLLARGIRKISSKRAGSLELFNLVKVSAVSGRGEMDTLTEVQLIEPYMSWRKFIGRVNVAYQLAETVDKLTPQNQPHPRIFNILSHAYSSLGQLGSDWQETTERWLVDIVRELGFWPQEQPFSGDIYELIEKISERHLNSPKLLNKLKNLKP